VSFMAPMTGFVQISAKRTGVRARRASDQNKKFAFPSRGGEIKRIEEGTSVVFGPDEDDLSRVV